MMVGYTEDNDEVVDFVDYIDQENSCHLGHFLA